MKWLSSAHKVSSYQSSLSKDKHTNEGCSLGTEISSWDPKRCIKKDPKHCRYFPRIFRTVSGYHWETDRTRWFLVTKWQLFQESTKLCSRFLVRFDVYHWASCKSPLFWSPRKSNWLARRWVGALWGPIETSKFQSEFWRESVLGIPIVGFGLIYDRMSFPYKYL